jgi:radical SAM superfamily enzyme YgiQ (UPF0313 family)
MMFAILLSVPRIAALRPAAAPAIIKSLLKARGLDSKFLDINLDFHNSVRQQYGDDFYWAIDDYFFNENKQLTDEQKEIYNSWILSWINKIKEYNFKWLMISVFTWQGQRFTKDFLTLWKENSNIPVIIGGQGLIREENGSFASIPKFAVDLKDQELIAHWVRGEIETTIDNIIDEDFKQLGIDTYSLAPYSDVNEHVFMDFSDSEIQKYHSGYVTGVLPIESSRGCVRNCMFCDIPTMHGGFRFKTGKRMFDEIAHYHETYKVDNFFFHDALCNGSVKDFRILNKLLVEYYQKHNLPKRSLKYSSHYIVRSKKLMPEHDFELMGAGGAECMVIGVESGSDKVRIDMRKGFTNEDLDYNMAMFSKYGINAYLLLIVGFPTETRKDFDDTLNMLKRYQPYVADGTIIGVNLGTTLTIEEGTPIWNEYPNLGIVGMNGNRPMGPDWKCLDNPTLTYKERILRRIEAQELAVKLGYTFWKGDDQLKLLMDNYQQRLNRYAGVIH